MTHLPYILAAYAIAIGMPLYLGVEAVFRVRAATSRLQAIDPRRDRSGT
jgi:hypothetical protein